MTRAVLAPFAGTVHPLINSPDPVFAEQMLGPGVAIIPESTEVIDVRSPVHGTIQAAFPHAFVVQTGTHSVLVHLGIDAKDANTFRLLAGKGTEVRAGDAVIQWDLAKHESQELSKWCAVIAMKPASIGEEASADSLLAVGAPLFTLLAPPR